METHGKEKMEGKELVNSIQKEDVDQNWLQVSPGKKGHSPLRTPVERQVDSLSFTYKILSTEYRGSRKR